jgi:hypothetical protein
MLATLIGAAVGNVPAYAAILISVDKTLQQMVVSVDGARKYTWPVSTGRPGYATPSGKFTAFRMEKDHFSKEWDDAPMPNSIFFTTEGHAIHGTFDARHLGSAASHGCVRISTAHAETLFDLVKAEGLPNTKVVITGGDRSAPLIAKRKTSPADALASENQYLRPQNPAFASPSAEYEYAPYRYQFLPRDGYGRVIRHNEFDGF